ncbi:hypothetical protein NHX12_022649 [Muraenolepis orangiensis]|uniref:Uncharacterized protein n=1 Tax=Muraenolepis orangiensis TaxID=630683 RepID=A0A9Q0IRG9_9TELE|nr:hypothetical protein NHX12_022649 [Muraenolepis orangiensis]
MVHRELIGFNTMSLEWDTRRTQGCRNGKEGDGRHAEEVREDEHSHALCNLGIAIVCRKLGAVDCREGGRRLELGGRRLDVHGQADAHFAVVTDPHERKQSNQ